ncbi:MULTISPECIES: PH domain-containing protein [unclassified Nocardioides]|uniref:PH domain-containing protein n=1 Tax=Nocardioides sp. URHA0032 TaxID=1380388 RepID=UPI0009DD09E1|nr:PH domain-containing protein [Nocardioides sp. URHA0032]
MFDGNSQAAPGWYPAGEVLRYWDGTAWTEHTAPVLPAEPESNDAPDKRADKQARRDAKQIERAAKQQDLQDKLDAAKAQRAASKAGDVRPDIEAAMAKMSYKSGSKREIRRLPEHLWHDERVELMVGGAYGPGTGILVLTDRRLIFVKDGMTAKVSEDFPLDKVSSVQWQTGMMLGTISIFASGNKAEIKNVQKTDGKALTDAVRARIAGTPQEPQAQPPAVSEQSGASTGGAGDAHERLRRLAELHRDGILTDDEFSAKKQQLLDEL